MPSQRHINVFGELDWGGGFSGIFFYEDVNQTENFIGRKSKMTYITGVKSTINPFIFRV